MHPLDLCLLYLCLSWQRPKIEMSIIVLVFITLYPLTAGVLMKLAHNPFPNGRNFAVVKTEAVSLCGMLGYAVNNMCAHLVHTARLLAFELAG